jgi:hypothetical protein
LTLESVGDGGVLTVNVAVVLLVTPPTVTDTFLGPPLAPELIANVAVMVVLFCTVKLVVLIFAPGLTAVVPVKPEPVSVTFTLVPRYPEFGETEVSPAPAPVRFSVTVGVTGSFEVMVKLPL